MTGTIAVSDLTENEKAGGRVEILGDNRILNCYDLNRKSVPIKFEVDLKEVDILKINLVYRSEEGHGNVHVLLADGLLRKNLNPQKKEPNETIAKLVEEKMINNNNKVKIISDHTMDDLFGNSYAPANLMQFETYGESIWGNDGYLEDRAAYAEYHLGEEYEKLAGTIAVSDKTLDEVGGKVVIIGDDKELAHYDITKKTEPIKVDVDIMNITWLRIELRFSTKDGHGTIYALLSDFEFQK